MSISTLAARNGLNGQTLRKQYKEVISDYRSWKQLGHVERYVLFPGNIGPSLSLDETCLSNDEVYTVLTNKAIREHREGRRAAKTKQERELIGAWEPKRMENGETMPQIMARSRHIILKHKSKWNEQQKRRAKILFRQFPRLEQAYDIFLQLVDIFNRKSKPEQARLNLARWFNKVEEFGNREFNRVLETFENHNVTIINYFEQRLTNASAESFNAKIKAFRTQFRGVTDIKFFMYRLAKLYS